jgi:hypothetical protein
VKTTVLLEEGVTTAARWRVSVLVRVTVLVDVLVDMVSATAASGRRSAATIVGRCILLKGKQVVDVQGVLKGSSGSVSRRK